MKLLVQRVKNAEVKVDGEVVGKINQGLLAFLGVCDSDTEETADYIVKKLVNLRIFCDENDKMNLSVKNIGGEILIISQFTLYADCTSGNRPSFVNAGKSEYAEKMYKYVINKCKESVEKVEEGIFGADMKVSLLNDGPVTIMIEK